MIVINRPCTRCGITAAIALGRTTCTACKTEQKRDWRRRHPKHVKAAAKKQKAYLKEYMAAYRADPEHREKNRAYQAAYRAARKQSNESIGKLK